MSFEFRTIYLPKRFPLAISRGVHKGSENLFVSITRNGVTGWGEMSPGRREGAETTELAKAAIEELEATDLDGLSVRQVFDRAREMGTPACALAAVDIALWDLIARQAGLPLYRLLGCGLPTVPTSVTIGINPPEVVRERVPLLLDGTGIRSLKIKLGSPDGIEADKAMYAQVVESTAGYDVQLRIDANGGWSVDDALVMMPWLAERGTDYVEQPLEQGQESELPHIFRNRPLPIYLDESCRFADSIPAWHDTVDGVNMKLMKCGGITGALDIIAVARAHGLKTMIGCMGESSLSISAAAAVTGALDHIDLDSHLNLDPDPCRGASLVDGIITPNELPGHGAEIINAE